MPAGTSPPRPTRRELAIAVLVATLCAVAFLREGIRPDRVVAPFAVEHFQPLQAELRAAGTPRLDEWLRAGNASLGDKYGQSLAWDRILQDRLRAGEIPLWTDSIAGGAPFVPQMAQVYQPWNLLLLGPWPSAGWYGISWTLHLIAFGVGAWWFLRSLGIRQPAALLGLVVACLGLWTQARIHHNVVLSAALPLWPLLTLVHGAAERIRSGTGPGFGPGRVAATALLFGISWSGGFAPVSLQVTGLTLLLAACLMLRDRSFRLAKGLGFGLALGGTVALAQMGPTLLASSVSARATPSAAELGALGMTGWHLLTLPWPELFHWPAATFQAPTWPGLHLAQDVYLHQVIARRFNWMETSFSIGLPATLAALLACWSRPRWVLIPLLLAGLLAFGLATGKSPFLELSAILPGARAGDLRRFLFVTSIALTVAAAAGADRLLDGTWPRRSLAIPGVAATVASLVLLFDWAAPGSTDAEFADAWAKRMSAPGSMLPGGQQVTFDMVRGAMDVRPGEIAEQHSWLSWTFGRVATIALLSSAALLFLRGARCVHALAALTALELLLAGSGTIVAMDVERLRAPTALEPVLNDTESAAPGAAPRLIRLMGGAKGPSTDLWPPNLGAYLGIQDLGAYNPLPPRAMEELFLAIEPDAPPAKPSAVLGGAGVLGLFDPASLDHPMLDVLGARYVLSSHPQPGIDGAARVDRTPNATPTPYRLIERTTTLPRATFVDTAEPTPTDDPTAFLRAPDWDPLASVHVPPEFAPLQRGDGQGDADVQIVSHRPGEVVLRVTAREPGYLRLADPWDGGWTAWLDGDPTPCMPADTYLRAVAVPEGAHLVEFRYDGPGVVWPQRLAFFGLLACMLLLAEALRRRLRGGKPNTAAPSPSPSPQPVDAP